MSTLHYYSGRASNSKLYTVREVYDFLHPYGELIHASFYKVLYMESECSINWCLSNRMNQKIICLRGINILTSDSNLGGVFSNKSSSESAPINLFKRANYVNYSHFLSMIHDNNSI